MTNPMKAIMEDNMKKQMDFQNATMKLQVLVVAAPFYDIDMMW